MTMLELLLLWTVKGTLILALAWAIALLLRRESAALRHAVWACAIAAQLVIPFASAVVPERAAMRVVPPVRFAAPVNVPKPVEAASTPSVPTPAPREARAEPRIHPSILLRWIWFAGAALVVLRLLAGTARIASIAKHSSPVVEGEWLSRTQRQRVDLAIARPVTLVWSESVPLPITWGFLYPTILLPETARAWPESFRRHVLLHELAHVRRLDALTQLIAQIALAAFWFNPLLWLATRRLRAEAEHACDDYVLRDGERPSTYATTLVELVRAHTHSPAPAFASLSVGRKSDLESRVGAIVEPARDCAAPGRPRVALIAVVMLLIVVPLAGIDRREPKKEAPLPAVRRSDCRPVYFEDDENIGGMSGMFRRKPGDPEVFYFFRRLDDGRCIEAMFSKATVFTPDDRDVAAVAGLDALVREKVGGSDRVAYLRSEGTAIERRLVVNGRERAWDAEARDWLARLMPEYVRRTYAGIPARAKRILERNGVEGLVEEIRQIEDADVRKYYLLTLVDRGEVPGPRLMDLARELLGSSEAVLGSFLAEAADGNVARSDVRDSVLGVLPNLDSEVERRIVLEKLVANPSRETRIASLRLIATLDSAIERRVLLQHAAPYFLGDDERLNDAYFDAVDLVHDPMEMKELLMSLAPRPSLPASVVPRIIRAAGKIRDAEERAEVLRAFDAG